MRGTQTRDPGNKRPRHRTTWFGRQAVAVKLAVIDVVAGEPPVRRTGRRRTWFSIADLLRRVRSY
jgi:hypothetical protein